MAVEHCPENIPSRSDVCFYHPLDDATAFTKDGVEVEWAGDMKWNVPDIRVGRAAGRGTLTGPQDYPAHPSAQNAPKFTAMAWVRKVAPPESPPVLYVPIHAGDQRISGTGGMVGGRIRLFTRPDTGGSWTTMTDFAVSGDIWESIILAGTALPQEDWEVMAQVKGSELDSPWSSDSNVVTVGPALPPYPTCSEVAQIFEGDETVTVTMPVADLGVQWNPDQTAQAQLYVKRDCSPLPGESSYDPSDCLAGDEWLPVSDVVTVAPGSSEVIPIDATVSRVPGSGSYGPPPVTLDHLIACRVRESDTADWRGAPDGSDGILNECAQRVQAGILPALVPLCETATVAWGEMPDERATNDTQVQLFWAPSDISEDWSPASEITTVGQGSVIELFGIPVRIFEVPLTVVPLVGQKFAISIKWDADGEWLPESRYDGTSLIVEEQSGECPPENPLPIPPIVEIVGAWSRRYHNSRRCEVICQEKPCTFLGLPMAYRYPSATHKCGGFLGGNSIDCGAGPCPGDVGDIDIPIQGNSNAGFWSGKALADRGVISEYREGRIKKIIIEFSGTCGTGPTGIIESKRPLGESEVIQLEWTPDGAPHVESGTDPEGLNGYSDYDGASQVEIEIPGIDIDVALIKRSKSTLAVLTFTPALEDQRTYRITLLNTPGKGLTSHQYIGSDAPNNEPRIEIRGLEGDITGGAMLDWSIPPWDNEEIGDIRGHVGNIDRLVVELTRTYCGVRWSLGAYFFKCCSGTPNCRQDYNCGWDPNLWPGYFDVLRDGEVTSAGRDWVESKAGNQAP